jgi:DNA topoisomerase-1
MPKNLIIVESPTKARTISKFLGSDFVIESSYGHIRDLPTTKLGVDIEHNFEPHYVIPRKAAPIVKKLKEAAGGAKKIILATDEDREGEAIAWHLTQALGLGNSKSQAPNSKQIQNPKSKIQKVERIVFHEITKKAIEEAIKNPRDIDMKRVDAQQARRILDRLVGYKLSPFLWKKVYRGLSAGRVQSVAVRLIVEREREIKAFKPQEYWSIEALLNKNQESKIRPSSTQLDGTQNQEFVATLTKINGETLDKLAIKNADEAEKIVRHLKVAEWQVKSVEKKAVQKHPLPPFTTSTLQQDAFRSLGFSAKQTMLVAQQLYEGVELGEEGSLGLITYMRTDSVNLSEESLKEAHAFLEKNLGRNYSLPEPRRFKTRTKGAQEAHEAIRPTDPSRTPESIKPFLDKRQYKLYDLIWRRFMATQMPSAIFDSTAVEIDANPKSEIQNPKHIQNSKLKIQNSAYTFRATGQVMKFDGFLKMYPMKFTETELPELNPEEKLNLVEVKPRQHFTQPTPRFTEASLIKTLEQNGIGRPSTYAPIISTIQERGYVEKIDRRFLQPTETGFIVNDLLVEHFPEVVDIQFTAKMEEEFDEIAAGTKEWRPVIKEFYDPFSKHLEEKYKTVKKQNLAQTAQESCEKCGKPMVVRLGRFGKFLACSGFPECRNTKTIKDSADTIDMPCPKCKEGKVLIRRTKRKKVFFGCSRYPECDFASWTDPRVKKESSQS